MGQFAKVGQGLRNYLSGSVSSYLGSEVVPLSKVGYIERLPYARQKSLTTNDKTAMIKAWRELIYSNNPKLLRNLKGESYIIQTMDGTHTTSNTFINYPDTISFS